MLRRQRQIRSQIQLFLDTGLFALSFWLAFLLRARAEAFGDRFVAIFQFFGGSPAIEPFEKYFPLLLVTIPIALVLLKTKGFYRRPFLPKRRQVAWNLFQACGGVTVLVVLVVFLAKVEVARGVVVFFGVLSFLILMIKEEVRRQWIIRRAGNDHWKRRLILVGSEEDTVRLAKELKDKSSQDIKVLARLDVYQASIERLVSLLHEHSANGVVLSATHTYFGRMEGVIQACELEGVEVWLAADFFKTNISQTMVDDLFGRPMLVFRSAPGESWSAVAKQALDFFGAAVLLVVGSPVFLVVALVIRLTSPGPVYFRQRRCGLNGQPFTMLKFRSMVSNAEQLKDELAKLNEMDGPVFKVSDDPRITPVGRFLRKYSLDELPQLVNVFRGEMSLVGPRPLPVDEVKRFDDLAHRRRLSVKPGLTCLWQISGRNNVTDFKDWVRLDLEYIDHWSFWLDLKILARTLPVVLHGTGAK